MGKAKNDTNKIEDGEFAVRLNSDISGGIGEHKKGTVLRNLSSSAFIGLTQGGGHTALKPGASADDAVDAGEVITAPLGTDAVSNEGE